MSERPRFIVHVDMDAFFAAVEQRDEPALRGRPVVVGADPKQGRGRGVVAACSYEARPFGIRSAMPISRAYRLCPQAVFLRADHDKYERESERIFTILERFTPDIEPLSIDEAFLDITHSFHLFGAPEETCRKIKRAIKSETGLTASVGLAPNKMTAKIASDLGKPDGLVVVTEESLLRFLHPLPIERLWGVGEKTQRVLIRLGLRTVGDIARTDRARLLHNLGQWGDHLWRLARGLDPRPVAVSDEVKSVGHEHTFDEDTGDPRETRDVLMTLSEKVSARLRRNGLQGRTVTLKVRLADFSTFTRAATLPESTNFADDIFRSAARRFEEFRPRQKIRLLGVSVSNLDRAADSPRLFPGTSSAEEKKEKLHRALDRIRDKFGPEAIGRRKANKF